MRAQNCLGGGVGRGTGGGDKGNGVGRDKENGQANRVG